MCRDGEGGLVKGKGIFVVGVFERHSGVIFVLLRYNQGLGVRSIFQLDLCGYQPWSGYCLAHKARSASSSGAWTYMARLLFISDKHSWLIRAFLKAACQLSAVPRKSCSLHEPRERKAY